MKKTLAAIAFGGVIGALAQPVFFSSLSAQDSEDLSTTYEQLDLFGEIFERIRSQYVEEVSSEELIENAVNGMLTGLDPHSSYLPPKDFDDVSVQTRGEFGGLGIEVTQENGFVKVVSPIDDTPAFEAGVEAGDIIVQIDGEPTQGLTLDEAVERMRGAVGEPIVITIVREGEDEPFDITIVRDTIKVTAVRGRVEGDTVVLRVSTFNRQTYPNLETEIEEQIAELGGIDNVNGFVVDLRFNPGGLLSQAIAVSDAFLDQGEIVSTRGRDLRDSERFNAKPGDLAQGKPMVVLINGASASASEIVAGALQDHNRAVVVGTRSFGKGSVQTIMPLGDDRAIRMTTARYYTPSGRSIQALGVQPDIIVEQERNDEEEVETEEVTPRTEADLRGSISNDSLSEDELKQLEEERAAQEEAAKRRVDDYQMAYALDILKGLAVLDQE
ncbi:MAG: S41 family peptidase [Pseudomonadota bacterium]